ncbi:hypothetical protein F5I97DRAFT_1828908 [Phlebopus sp. FC_14]|nr:hypothetical protein F5I97DRAFT_1828908 [Phlebopus sp. FC_14]
MAALDNTLCVTWYYYGRYPSDPWYIKVLVGAVLLSDTAHQALIAHCDFGQLAQLGVLVWSLIVEVLFNGFTALMVQSFLAMRVYRLSNRSILATGSVMALVTGEFILVVVYVAKGLHFQTFVQLTQLKSLSMSVNAVAAAGDVLIAIFLCTLLQRSRTGFRRSDTMITKLIVFTINTGLLTSVCAVASLVSIAVWPTTFIYIAFYFCLGRLYCNSLLATLNARKGLRGESNDEMSLSLQGVQKTNQSMIGTSQRRIPNNISIKIDTTQEFVRDEHSMDWQNVTRLSICTQAWLCSENATISDLEKQGWLSRRGSSDEICRICQREFGDKSACDPLGVFAGADVCRYEVRVRR